jgi:hypothetical protein
MEEFHAFTMPRGYVDETGVVHRDGLMRLARAGDEILPLEDPRVQGNRAYLVILLLSRVIVKLGTLEGDRITPALVERMYASDIAYLQSFYRKLNGVDAGAEMTCPHCGRSFAPPPSAGA